MINACIVGCGAISPLHINSIEKSENAKLYAVCDINPQKLEKFRDKDLICYDNYDDVLNDNNIGSVHICTPHYLHYEMIIKALEKGKKVVCEKPVTMTDEEYKILLTHPHQSEVCVVLQNRLNPCTQKIKDIVENETYGKVLGLKAVVTWQRDKAYYQSEPWRGIKKTEGGGALINQFVHTLDYFPYLISDIKSVRAKTANFSLEGVIEVEDTVCAYLTLSSGVTGIFLVTNAHVANTPPEFEIVFENATLRYADNCLSTGGVILERDEIETGKKAYWGLSHAKLISNFYDKNIYFCPKDIKNTMDAMFSIYKSADNNGKEILL
ncbi:MAG: Gfo/Idh/MocA family oxidoreductase [Clostridia bacterium]|nr:Gfo/Idh/MocA family oxidoreductase [Clostridia bacterium]